MRILCDKRGLRILWRRKICDLLDWRDHSTVIFPAPGSTNFRFGLADEYTGSHLGIGCERFLREGSQILPAETNTYRCVVHGGIFRRNPLILIVK